MSPIETVGSSSAVEDLKTNWENLNHVVRALKVHALHKTGWSFRRLEQALGRSASLLRNLDKAAQAPKEDLDLARKGQISTRELTRRSKAAAIQRAANDKETLNKSRIRRAHSAAKVICKWQEEQQLWPTHGQTIIEEARIILARAEFSGNLPKSPPPPSQTRISEIISRMRPPAIVNAEIGEISWYADWLARWSFYAFRDGLVRDMALNIAIESQVRNVTVPQKRRAK